MRNVLAQIGGTFDRDSVIYAEVAAAGEVAIVPIQSGGSAGNLAVAILALGRAGPQVFSLLTPDSASRGGLRVAVENGQLVGTSALFGPEDARCCPSQLKHTYYTWDGSKLRVERQLTTSSAPSVKN